MKISISFTGITEAIARTALVKQLLAQYIRDDLEWFGETVSQGAKTDHPYKDHTGYLTASIGYLIEEWSNGHITVTVQATAPYAEEVEYGTTRSRPYPFLWPKFYESLPALEVKTQASADRAFADAMVRIP